jgi:hypothetical protein
MATTHDTNLYLDDQQNGQLQLHVVSLRAEGVPMLTQVANHGQADAQRDSEDERNATEVDDAHEHDPRMQNVKVQYWVMLKIVGENIYTLFLQFDTNKIGI